MRPFRQIDVFTAELGRGNPVAVVHDADGIADDDLAAFARWTNLSETTFLLQPRHPDADYRLRIFTPGGELDFAGHPTIGSARAWLQAGGMPRRPGTLVQECGIGLVELRVTDDRIAFDAPGFRSFGPLDTDTLAHVARALRIPDDQILDASSIDNGPGWIGVRLADADAVLALDPDFAAMLPLQVGVIGPHPAGEAEFEVRAFCPGFGIPEDPVTGSLAAGFARWLVPAGVLPERCTIRQGTALRRDGRIRVERDGDRLWIGGETADGVAGTVALGGPRA
jgi:PhzF family phenazine biosynthesis protein